jgi:hypothetical protein
MKSTIIKVLMIAIIGLCYSCGSSSSDKSKTDANQTNEQTNEPKTNWVYSEKINEMDDTKTFFAENKALEQMQFKFPYDGGTDAWILVRKGSNGLDIALIISKGQFLHNYGGNNYIKVRFDDNQAETYSYNAPADHSTTAIFIKNEAKFLKGLKSANQVIIQSEFFDEGTQIMKFNTEGFVWEH